MRIAVGSDEKCNLTEAVIAELELKGIEVELYGALNPSGFESLWPQVGRNVGRRVASGGVDQGILFCWTGTGVSIAANKVPGVRAALCTDATTAAGAKKWNHANVLVMSLRSTSPQIAVEILGAWITTPYGDDKDAECVARVTEIEQSYGAITARH